MVRDGLPGGRWVAGAECPGGLCQVACTHILRLAQEGSAATTITRDCSGSLTRGSSRRTRPFSTTPTTATGWRWRRCPSRGRGCSPGGMTGWGRCGSEASCSSRALRRSLLRSGWGVGMGVASQSVGGDDEDRRLVDLSEHVRNLLVLPVVSPDHPDPAARWHLCEHPEGAIATLVKLVDPVEGGLDLLGGEAVAAIFCGFPSIHLNRLIDSIYPAATGPASRVGCVEPSMTHQSFLEFRGYYT